MKNFLRVFRELDDTNISGGSVNTPSAGLCAWFADTDKRFKQKDDTGFITSYKNNFSIAAQAPVAATRTYISGSNISIGGQKLQIGSRFRWKFNMTKTGAGVATSTIDICVGTAATTADTARVSFTKPVGTAVIDEGWVEIECICRGPLTSAGVFVAEIIITHNLAATGHMTVQQFVANVISSGFDVTVANLIVGLCITTGAADAITIQQCTAEGWNV